MARLFDRDPLTGKIRWFHFNHEDKSFTIETVQEVQDLVDQNAELQNTDNRRFGEWDRVASVPINVYFDLKARGIIDPQNDPKGIKLKQWLNDSDNRKFRTKLGQV
jgi:hypothetical protein